jgi:hypothetical protein
MFKTVSFEEAVRLFKEWGFQVEPGPRPGEVTLIIEAPDYRCCTVYDAGMLPQIATVALEVRWQNGSMAAAKRDQGREERLRQVAVPAGAASLLRH